MIKKNSSNIRFIDLGLPSKILWGNKNFGNNKYYQWGELQGYSENQIGKEKMFEWKYYRFCKDDKITKYNNSDKLLELLPEDDVVTQTLGKNYRIPRKEDFEELLGYTDKIYNKNSVIFKSRINGNQIIFHLLGYVYDSSVVEDGLCCNFWSSSLQENDPIDAFELYIYSRKEERIIRIFSDFRCYGYIIRPIKFKI